MVGLFACVLLLGRCSGQPSLAVRKTGTLQYGDKCLDLPGGDTTNGNQLWLWDCNGSSSQVWTYDTHDYSIPGYNLASSPYRLMPSSDESKCVDLPAGDEGGVLDGTQLWIWDCLDKKDDTTVYYRQSWYVGHNLDPQMISRAMRTIPDGEDNGSGVRVWNCYNEDPSLNWCDNEGFVFVQLDAMNLAFDAGAAVGATIQSTTTGQCLDLPGGDTSNGAYLWMWDCNGGDNQQWSFQGNQLVYAPNPSKCVDLLGGDTTNGNRIGLWDCYDGASQQWGFDPEAGKMYLASSAHEATKCLMALGKYIGVEIWDCIENNHMQMWTVGSELDDPLPAIMI